MRELGSKEIRVYNRVSIPCFGPKLFDHCIAAYPLPLDEETLERVAKAACIAHDGWQDPSVALYLYWERAGRALWHTTIQAAMQVLVLPHERK
jgi:hypothetical protein